MKGKSPKNRKKRLSSRAYKGHPTTHAHIWALNTVSVRNNSPHTCTVSTEARNEKWRTIEELGESFSDLGDFFLFLTESGAYTTNNKFFDLRLKPTQSIFTTELTAINFSIT